MSEMSANEKLVRAAWNKLTFCNDYYPGTACTLRLYGEFNGHRVAPIIAKLVGATKASTWKAGAEWIIKRQQEITELREQLNQLVNLSACYYCPEPMQIMQRTIDLVQSALTEAQRGMKEAPHI